MVMIGEFNEHEEQDRISFSYYGYGKDSTFGMNIGDKTWMEVHEEFLNYLSMIFGYNISEKVKINE
jgi:hypothetical protein